MVIKIKQFSIRAKDFNPRQFRRYARLVDGMVETGQKMVGKAYENPVIASRPYGEIVGATFSGEPLPETELERDLALALRDLTPAACGSNYLLFYQMELDQNERAAKAVQRCPELEYLTHSSAGTAGGHERSTTEPIHEETIKMCDEALKRAEGIYVDALVELDHAHKTGRFSYRALGVQFGADVMKMKKWMEKHAPQVDQKGKVTNLTALRKTKIVIEDPEERKIVEEAARERIEKQYNIRLKTIRKLRKDARKAAEEGTALPEDHFQTTGPYAGHSGEKKVKWVEVTYGEALLNMFSSGDYKDVINECEKGIVHARDVYLDALADLEDACKTGKFTYRTMGLKPKAWKPRIEGWMKDNVPQLLQEPFKLDYGWIKGKSWDIPMLTNLRDVKFETDNNEVRDIVKEACEKILQKQYEQRVEPLRVVRDAACTLDAASGINPLYQLESAIRYIDANFKENLPAWSKLNRAREVLEIGIEAGTKGNINATKAAVPIARTALHETQEILEKGLEEGDYDGKWTNFAYKMKKKVRKLIGKITKADQMIARPLNVWNAVVSGRYYDRFTEPHLYALYHMARSHLANPGVENLVFEFVPEGRMGGTEYGVLTARVYGEGKNVRTEPTVIPPEFNRTVNALRIASELFLPPQPGVEQGAEKAIKLAALDTPMEKEVAEA
jgi:hypothetical protein